MAHLPPNAFDDAEHDDLAALDFDVRQRNVGETDLAAILEFEPPTVSDALEPWDAPRPWDEAESFGPNASDADAAMPMYTITNPPGTVAVTTMMDGRVYYVDLSPDAETLTEAVLAEEIVVIAGLATQDARSAQYTLMLEGMREHGHDTVGTRDFLNRDLGLPSPEQVRQARAELFAKRYRGGR